MSRAPAPPGPGSRLSGGLLLVVLVGSLLLPAQAARAADPVAAAEGLTVHLTRMSSAAIPAQGTLELAGTVTNDTEETYGAVNVQPFLSSVPMTTREQLETASETDPGTEVGLRLTEAGQFDPVGDVAPGQTVSFDISLPASVLPQADGVYWIGVHALGQTTAGRGLAGLARTFIPKVTGKQPRTPVALVVPVRAAVRRDAVGRLLKPAEWSRSLAPEGRLGRIAAFLGTDRDQPLTMLVDPAVLEAVGDLSENNPPVSLGTPVQPEDTPSSSESPSRSGVRLEAGDRANAKSWLSAVRVAADRHTVLGLGYADPDVAALIRQGSPLRAVSNKLAEETFAALKIDAVPTVAPPNGWLDDAAIARLRPGTTVLLSDHGDSSSTTRLRTGGDQDLVLSDQRTSSGGTGPTAPLDALALRQRIVADAALRRTAHLADPLVVQLPATWNPGADWQQADFFDALDLPWLDLVGVQTPGAAPAPLLEDELGYPAEERKHEVPTQNVAAARVLTQTTSALAELLQSENDVEHDLTGIALDAVSLHARGDEVEARMQVLDTNAAMQQRLGKVEVLGTDFVTLSGGSGTLAVTLVNGLDQPVLVGVQPRTSTGDVTIEGTKPVKMAPGERTVLRLKAKASTIGVTRVVLTPVTTDGRPLGTPLSFSLRTSQVGKAIWAVIIAGAVLLVVMVLLRVRRGLREHRWRGRA